MATLARIVLAWQANLPLLGIQAPKPDLAVVLSRLFLGDDRVLLFDHIDHVKTSRGGKGETASKVIVQWSNTTDCFKSRDSPAEGSLFDDAIVTN